MRQSRTHYFTREKMKFQMCLKVFLERTSIFVSLFLIYHIWLCLHQHSTPSIFVSEKGLPSLKDCLHSLQRGRCRKIEPFSFLVCCYFFFCFSLFSFMRYIAQSFTIRLTETFSKPNCFVFAFLLDRKACQSPIMETGRWKVSVSGSNGLQKTHPRKTQNMTGRCC